MKYLKQLKFWKKFTRYFIMLSIFGVLALGSQQGLFGSLWQQGPEAVLANTCADNGDGTCDLYDDSGNYIGRQRIGSSTGPAQGPSQGPSQGPTKAPSCQPTTRQYPQCGGSTGLGSYSNTDTIMVTETTNCDGSKSYSNQNLGNLGQCAVPAPQQPAPQQPAPVTQTQTYTMCDGRVKNWDQIQSELHVAGYPGPWDVNSSIAAYNRAACPTPQPQPAPQPQPQPQPAPVCTWTRRGNFCDMNSKQSFDLFVNSCTGEEKRQNYQQEEGYCGYQTPRPTPTPTPTRVCKMENIGNFCEAYSNRSYDLLQNTCTGEETRQNYQTTEGRCGYTAPRPTPTPAPTQAPQAVATSTVSCPAGTVGHMERSILICVSQSQSSNNVNNNTNVVNVPAQQPQVVYAQAPVVQQAEPKVVYQAPAEVRELPKTGLPLAAWFLSGLVPVGVKLKRFGKGDNGSVNPALNIWQTRTMLKDLI